MNGDFYRMPSANIAQGDVFIDVPSVYVPNSHIVVVRRRQTSRGPVADLYALGDAAHQPQRTFDPSGDEYVGQVQVAHALILTHACEIDNSPRATITLGLIRPMRAVPEDARSAIRDGRNIRFLYLPANDDPPLAESYVDFSRLTSIRRQALPQDKRILSLTETTLKALYVGLIRYVTRFELPDAEILGLVRRAVEDAGAGAG